MPAPEYVQRGDPLRPRRYVICSSCQRPLRQGYDSPKPNPVPLAGVSPAPGDERPPSANPIVCGPCYKGEFAEVYPEATVPDVEDGYLEDVA